MSSSNASNFCENLIPFGYCLVGRGMRHIPKPEDCPPKYFQIYGCFCEGAIPDWDVFSEPEENDFKPLAKKWKISETTARELYKFCRSHAGEIDFTFLHFRNFEIACEVRKRFFADRNDIVLIGRAVLDPDFLNDIEIRKLEPLPTNGKLLGFDLYGSPEPFSDENIPRKPNWGERSNFSGLSCSLSCCIGNATLALRLGVPVNDIGFFQNSKDALSATELVNREHLGEPIWYFPIALIQYYP